MSGFYTNPLQIVIDEFQTISPETTNALIFRNDGRIIANTKAATEEQTKNLILNFNNITQQAETIGGLENLTIQASDSQLNVTAMNDLFLATVSTRTANHKIVKSLTQTVIPTIVQLLDQLSASNTESQLTQSILIEETIEEPISPAKDEPNIDPINEPQSPETIPPISLQSLLSKESDLTVNHEPQPEAEPEPQPIFEPLLPKVPVVQFMVEKMGGIFVSDDTVGINRGVVAEWIELFDGKQISQVNIEALDGRKITCKFKAIRDAGGNATGIIQIPAKIRQTLQIEKGRLVMVKPVID